MKKPTTKSPGYLILALLFCIPVFGQNDKREILKGKVKYATVVRYDLLQAWGQSPKDSLVAKVTFTFDGKGNILMADQYNVKTNTVHSKDERVYDNKGNLVELSLHDSTGPDVKNVYKYDVKNREVERITYLRGEYYEKVVTSRDDKNLTVVVRQFDADGSTMTSDSSKVDAKGNQLENYDEEGKLVSRSSYHYNAKGQIIQEKWESWEIEHMQGTIKLEYDKMGNEVQRINIDMNGDTTYTNKIEFVYDKYGNWIQQIRTWSYNPISETYKREFVYD